MLRSASMLLLTAAVALPAMDATSHDPSTPEGRLMITVEALRNDDFGAMLATMPAAKQAEAEAGWTMMQSQPLPPQAMQVDMMMGMLTAPNAVDNLAMMMEPQLMQLNPQELAMGLGMGMQFAMADPNIAAAGPEAQQVMMGLLTGMQQWVPTAGINDPQNLRAALGIVSAWANAQDWTNFEALRQRPLADALVELGEVTRMLKDVLAVYQLNTDDLLDSITVSRVSETTDDVTLNLAFTAFGADHNIPVTMIQDPSGIWTIKPPEPAAEGAAPDAGAGGFGSTPPPF